MKLVTRKTLRKAITALTISASLFAVSAPALADVGAYVAKDATKNYYYDFQALLDSYIANKANPTSDAAKVFQHYEGTIEPTAFYDNTRHRYVDFKDILDAYIASKANNTPFDIDQYTTSSTAFAQGLPDMLFNVRMDGANLDSEQALAREVSGPSVEAFASGDITVVKGLGGVLTATIKPGSETKAVQPFVLVAAIKSAGLVPKEVKIGATEVVDLYGSNLASHTAQLKSAIAALAGKGDYASVTLGDLKGKNVTGKTIQGQDFTLTVAQ